MRRVAWIVAASAALAGCHTGPTLAVVPSPSAPSAPVSITLVATPGIGATAGTVFVTAHVFDASGTAVGLANITFSTSTGTVQPAVMNADPGGVAQTTVRTTAPATVRAVAGQAAASINVTPNGSDQPPVDSSPLTIRILATPAAAGSASIFALSAPALQQETWTFGDGASAVTTTHTATHVYGAAGNYTVGVTAVDPNGRTATATTDITVPAAPNATTPTTPTPTGLVVTMTCVTGKVGTPTSCNLAATYNGTPLQSTAPTFKRVDWDWGDGNSTLSPTPPSTAPASPLGSWIYTQAGTYAIVANVTVNTSDGAKTTTVTQTVSIS